MTEITVDSSATDCGHRFPSVRKAGRLAIGVLLVTAAFLKASSPWESLLLESAYRVPRTAALLAIQAEIALGAAMLFNIWPRQTRRVAMASFALFAAFSAYRAIGGAESCGCFGPIKIAPWWTFGVDLAVIGVLAVCEPEQGEQRTNQAGLAFAGYAAAGGSCLVLATLIAPSENRTNPILKDVGEVSLLEPDEWIGQPFPLGEFIEPSKQFSTGEWILLLYHHDCPKCRAARPKYEALVEKSSVSTSRSLLLIEVPPYGPEKSANSESYARLTNDREWFVQAPVEITLHDGIVTGASLDLPSI